MDEAKETEQTCSLCGNTDMDKVAFVLAKGYLSEVLILVVCKNPYLCGLRRKAKLRMN